MRTAKRPASMGRHGPLEHFLAPPGWGSVQRRGKHWVVRYVDENGKRRHYSGDGRPELDTRAEAEYMRSFIWGLIVAERMDAVTRQDSDWLTASVDRDKQKRRRRLRGKEAAR